MILNKIDLNTEILEYQINKYLFGYYISYISWIQMIISIKIYNTIIITLLIKQY